MPRSSRHRSHRGHKHSSRETRERSDSEEERNPKAERRRGSPPAAAAEAEFEHGGRKRKERDVPEAGDRWNGEEEEKDRGEEQPYEEEKAAAGKSRSLGGRSSRRHEGESRGEESRRRYEREVERERRSSRDEREREKVKEHEVERERERDYMQERSKEYERKREKERRMADGEREQRHSARDRSLDGRREKSSYSSTVSGSYEDEYVVKGDYEAADRPRQDGIYDRGTEKDLRKEIKRDEFNEKDKWHGDGRKSDDRRVATMDDRSKSSYGSHYDEKYKDGGSREKFYDEFDRERRSRTDKYRGERSSRDHNSDRSDSKHYKDSDKPIESHNRSKIQDNDCEVTPVTKEYNMKYADSRGRKRSPDDNAVYADVKPRHAKEARSSVDRSALDNYKLGLDDGGRIDAAEKYKLDYNDDRGRSGGVDNYKPESHDDGGRPESIHSNRVDVTPSRDPQKNSPVLTGHATKDEYRHSSKHAEPLRRSLSKERHHTSSASSGDPASVSGAAERMLDYQSVESSVKFKESAHSVDFVADEVPAPTQCERTPTSDGNAPAMPYIDKSPSSSDRQNPNRKGARRSLDVDEMGQRGNYQKEGRDHLSKEERGRDFSQGQLPNSEASRSGLLPHSRADQITRSSPGHLPPPPPARHGVDSPSVLRSGEDDGRGQADRKINNQYKRGDPSMGRGQGGAWNGVPSWPPPVANGFLPFQHGPSSGYLPVPQQFPPPMFGVRPFVDFNHGGVPLHMHEPPPDRFSGHGRPFGWRNPSDDSGPRHMQGWDGNSGIFGNDSHMYVRPEWEPNRHPVGERGWEVNGSPWKGQSAGTNLDKEIDSSTCPSADEPRTGQSLSVNECNMTENNEIKPPVDSAGKGTPDSTRKMKDELPEPLKSEDGGSDFCSTYLSKLDISHDLTCPDLYKQCINNVGNEEHEVVGRRAIKCALDQDSNGSIKLVTGRLIFMGKPMFPAIADTVFKKAMSLYKKTCGEPRPKKLHKTVEPEEGSDSPSQALGVENPKPMENVIPGDPATDNLKKMDSPKLVDNNAPKAAEADESEAVNVVKGDSPPLSNSTGGDIMEEDSGKIGSPGGVEAISAGDKECGGLMPECLSRIPVSPKSTH